MWGGLLLVGLSSVDELEGLIESADIDILLTVPFLPVGASADSQHEESASVLDMLARHAEALRRVQVIFLTDAAQPCPDLYRVEHVYALAKPLDAERLADAIDRAVQRHKRSERSMLTVSVCSSILRVPIRRIDYVEAHKRKVHIHAGARTIESYTSLRRLAAELPESFALTHKSYLVNLNRVESFEADHVRLFSGASVPVSQKRSKRIRDLLLEQVASKGKAGHGRGDGAPERSRS